MAAIAFDPIRDEPRLDYARRAVVNFARQRSFPAWIDRDDLVQEGIEGVLRRPDIPDHAVGRLAVSRALDYLRRLQGRYDDEDGKSKVRPLPASVEQMKEAGVEREAPEQFFFFREALLEADEKRAEVKLYETDPTRYRENRLARFREEGDQDLHPAELDVLVGAAEGETADATAKRRSVSIETVKSQRRNVIAKLAAKNVQNAVHIAHQRGLLS